LIEDARKLQQQVARPAAEIEKTASSIAAEPPG
jgi:hypothetical protein